MTVFRAFRRLGFRLDAASGAITSWLYRDPNRKVERMASTTGFPLSGREVVLTPPLSEETVRALKVGDVVTVNGYLAKDGTKLAHARDIRLPDGRRVLVGSAPETQ